MESCPRDFPPEGGCDPDVCAQEEDPARCPHRCQLAEGAVDADGVCGANENIALCAADCPLTCGDGVCMVEEVDSCPRDCGPCLPALCVCGDAVCNPVHEDEATCLVDCHPTICGDDVTEGAEACDDGNLVPNDACTDVCQPATCGDGIVWTGVEVCDDGNVDGSDDCREDCKHLAECGDGVLHVGVEECDDGDSDDVDDCTNACEAATCGDGIVHAGVEECDDDNSDDSDDCTSACEFAVCGDGFVRAGVEECDDGNLDDTDDCSAECERPRVAFITSLDFTGNLGGLAGADARCVAAATAAGLAGPDSFRAWLATATDSPASRFAAAMTPFRGKYVRVDGASIAKDGWDDLTDGTIAARLEITEFGTTRATTAVWTGATAQGTPAVDNCEGWSSNLYADYGHGGVSSDVVASWTSNEKHHCSDKRPLYCFEQ